MVSAALLLGIAFFAIYVVRTVRTYYSLKQFGGHWSAGWSRLWLLRTQGSGEMNLRFTAINKKYGESCRCAGARSSNSRRERSSNDGGVSFSPKRSEGGPL